MNITTIVNTTAGMTKWAVILGALAVVWMLYRSTFGRKNGHLHFLPSSAPRPDRMARWMDAVILGASAAILLAYCATNESAGGLIHKLHEMHPKYAKVNILMLAGAGLGVAISLWVTQLGRPFAGMILLANVLVCYGWILNSGEYPGSWFLSSIAIEPKYQYTISLSGSGISNADLWVNGVYLGKTPYTAPHADFLAAVPYWPNPPADHGTERLQGNRNVQLQGQRNWFAIQVPTNPKVTYNLAGNQRTVPVQINQASKTYYAQVKFGGEWGLGSGGTGTGSSGNFFSYNLNSNITAIFPQRQQRLEMLLKSARLSDYHVTVDWCKSMDSFGTEGAVALRRAAVNEPEMMQALDAWAMWKYGLDKVTDAESSWKVFEGICQDVEQGDQYLTTSVTGRAVELLAQKLPVEPLMDRAEDLIQNTGSLNFCTWEMNGRMQFGDSIGGKQWGRSNSLQRMGDLGAPPMPITVFPVFHAVWMVYGNHPEIVQQRIAPEILRCWYRAGRVEPLRVAAYFGGSAVDSFFLRQDWRAKPDQLPAESRVNGSNGDANQWLFLLANLNDDSGRTFRRIHAQAVMDLADRLYNSADRFNNSQVKYTESDIDFVFADRWLATQYWPQFSRLARENSPDRPMEAQWKYLVRMGDAATASMYAEASQDVPIDSMDFGNATYLLSQMPSTLRSQVIELLIPLVKGATASSRELTMLPGYKETLIAQLKSQAEGNEVYISAKRNYDFIISSTTNKSARNGRIRMAADTIARTPDSPLVEMLAEADDPELRLMACPALEAYPTPSRRRLLVKLLTDPDPAVQSAARDVQLHLSRFLAVSPSLYASDAANVMK